MVKDHKRRSQAAREVGAWRTKTTAEVSVSTALVPCRRLALFDTLAAISSLLRRSSTLFELSTVTSLMSPAVRERRSSGGAALQREQSTTRPRGSSLGVHANKTRLRAGLVVFQSFHTQNVPSCNATCAVVPCQTRRTDPDRGPTSPRATVSTRQMLGIPIWIRGAEAVWRRHDGGSSRGPRIPRLLRFVVSSGCMGSCFTI